MARILITLPPLVGHLNPALAVAEALTARGHTLAWAVHARQIGNAMPKDARIYKLDSTAEAADIAIPSARGLESVRLFFEDYTFPMARAALPPLEEAARLFRPDVMVVDHQMPAGALVARKLGLPWVTLVTTSASIQHASPTIDAWVGAQFTELQRGYLPEHMITSRPDISPYSVIVFSIQLLAGNARALIDAPYHFVGPALAQFRRQVDFPWGWLDHEQRLILVTLGTISRDANTRFFEIMMEALATFTGVQAVMVAPATLAARAPTNVLVRETVPQLKLLDWATAVICHAGHNTVCEALTRGLPLIVSPIRDDQPVVARQVIDAGAGLFMRHGKVTVATARATIETLLNTPALAERAATLGEALRAAPGAAGAASAIVSLATGGQCAA
jgi:MGT family glycosyltransferase